jgi:hypothetical protein
MLTMGSAVLAVVNIVVMWGMAHRWRYAWHGNLGLQLLWLPYDTVTKQYGLLALGAVMTVVSVKGCLQGRKTHPARAVRSGPRHRGPRRAWFGRRGERTGMLGRRPGPLRPPGGVTGTVSTGPASRIAANRRPIAIEVEAHGCRDLADASPCATAKEITTDDEWHEIAAAGTG